MDLEKDELKVLIQALEVWENSNKTTAELFGVMASMMVKGQEKYEKIARKWEEKDLKETERRKKIAAMLKAKLYIMRSKLTENDKSEGGE